MSAREAADLEGVLEETHRALDAFARGDHQPLADLYSKRDDVTLGNPFGPFVRGFASVVQTMERAASYYRDGEAAGFDHISEYLTPDLACIVEVEQFNAKIGGRAERSTLSLRCSSVFRREDGECRLVHRHADPITSDRSAESVLA